MLKSNKRTKTKKVKKNSKSQAPSQRSKYVIEYESDDEASRDGELELIQDTKCIAIRKTGKNKGTRCTNNKKAGFDYCGVHKPKYEEGDDNENDGRKGKCIALTKKGTLCKKKGLYHNNKYCYTHKDNHEEPPVPVVPVDPMSEDERNYKLTFTCYGKSKEEEASLLHPREPKLTKTGKVRKQMAPKPKHDNVDILIFKDNKVFLELIKLIHTTRDVKTRLLLKEIFVGSRLEISHYVNNDPEQGETPEWVRFLNIIDHTGEFEMMYSSVLERVFLIVINSIDLDSVGSGFALQKNLLHTKKNYKTKFHHPLSTIKFDPVKAKEDMSVMFSPVWKSEFLQKSWLPDHCCYDVIIEKYEKEFNRYPANKRKNITLTYELLNERYGFTIGMTIPELIEKWCRVVHQDLCTYDLASKLDRSLSYIHSEDQEIRILPNGNDAPLTPNNKNYARSPLHICVGNGHIQLTTSNFNSLTLKVAGQLEKDQNTMIVSASAQFRLPSKKVATKFIILDNWRQINTFDLSVFDPKEIKNIKFVVPDDLERILFDLYSEFNYIASIRSTPSYRVQAVYLKMMDFNIEICNPDYDPVLNTLKFEDGQYTKQEQFDRFNDLKALLQSSVMNSTNMSSHKHNLLDFTYSPKPLSYRVDGSSIPNVSIDMSKAYGKCFSEISEIPVFDDFCDWKDYDGSNIKKNNMYLVERTLDLRDDILCNTIFVQKTTEYSGAALIMLHERNENWRNYCQITKFKQSTSAFSNEESIKILKSVFNDPILSELAKKFICCIMTGVIEKRKNTDTKTLLTTCGDEATYYATKYKTRAWPIQPPTTIRYFTKEDEDEDEDYHRKACNPLLSQSKFDSIDPLWYITTKAEANLEEGFYSIKVMIYSLMRIYLLDMCNEVKKLGGEICAFRVDCVYANIPEHVTLPATPKNDPVNLFSSLGKLKWARMTKDDLYPVNKYKDKSDVVIVQPEVKPVTIHTLENEKDWKDAEYIKEAITLFDKIDSNLLIEATVGGAGKTYLALEIAKEYQRRGKSVHIAVQNNLRSRRLPQESDTDIPCTTLERVLNLTLYKGKLVVSKTKNRVDKANLDLLLIDEIYYHDIQKLSAIRRLMEHYPDLRIIGMGDVCQSRIQIKKLHINEDEHWKNCMRSMFQDVIQLNVNKRLLTLEDQIKMLKIKDYLLVVNPSKQDIDIPYIRKCHSFKEILDNSINENGECVSKFITYLNNTSDSVDMMVHERILRHPKNKGRETKQFGSKILWIGMELTKHKHKSIGKSALHSNYIYTVAGFSTRTKTVKDKETGEESVIEFDVVLVVDEETDEEFWVTTLDLQGFRYGYARTCLSTQGDTYSEKEPLIIMDYKKQYMSNKNIYTSILRTKSLDSVCIYTGNEFDYENTGSLESKILNRIENHKSVDVEAGRLWTNDEDYVDREWVHEQFSSNDTICPFTSSDSQPHNYSLYESGPTAWSIDRLDNRLPHVKSNCVIGCRNCNVKRK